jgi:predicted membrane-bound mannosyltransferase
MARLETAVDMRIEPVRESTVGFSISVEVVAYLGILVLALVLRIAQLDVVPLGTNEARQALAAWRVVNAEAPGLPIVPESPLMFALHSLSFSVLGANEFSARILTVLAGVGLLLTPLLFRSILGSVRTFVLVLLLSLSPILLATTRMDSPLIWATLFVVLGIYFFWHYTRSRQNGYAIAATLMMVMTALLTDSTGIFLMLIVLLAGWLTGRKGFEVTQDDVSPPETISIRQGFPWVRALGISGLVVFLITTLFMLYPAGLSAMGELLRATLTGFTTRSAEQPFFFPWVITLFYEPVTVVMGVVAMIFVLRGTKVSLVDRFLSYWVVLAGIFSLIYVGASAEHTLWLVVPLTALVSRFVTRQLLPDRDPNWWHIPYWARWAVAGVIVAAFSMLAIHAQTLARSFMTGMGVTFEINNPSTYNLVLMIIAVLFLLVCYFVASSEWGDRTAIRGVILGVVAFFGITSLGSGWHISVFNAEDPVELWNRNPTNLEVFQLRNTLLELGDRQTAGFPEVRIAVIAPDDGVVAWAVRDFRNAQFIPDSTAARGEAIVLMPASITQPDLGGPYVGRTINISRQWRISDISLLSFPAWWLQRRTLTGSLPDEQYTLWLRQDIYNGVQGDQGF